MKRATLGSLLSLWLLACGAPQQGGPDGLLEPGTPAPDFMAQDQHGEVRQFRILNRNRPVVLFFYPRDGTPGCTREACAFRDAWDRLQATGAIVVGVSTDDVESHARFAEEHDLPFPLLADPDGHVLRAYRVPSRLGMAARVTYIVGADGRIARVFPEVDPAVHADEVIAALNELAP
ncbi:MAG TPA: peroxiredoxin [Sandaracinaceae bacterium]